LQVKELMAHSHKQQTGLDTSIMNSIQQLLRRVSALEAVCQNLTEVRGLQAVGSRANTGSQQQLAWATLYRNKNHTGKQCFPS